MPVAPSRPCLTTGCPALVTRGRRCAQHAVMAEAQRNYERGSPRQRGYSWAWEKIVKAAIEAQPWCAQCGSTVDLVGDHIKPVHYGGASVVENCQVLCALCNARKSDR